MSKTYTRRRILAGATGVVATAALLPWRRLSALQGAPMRAAENLVPARDESTGLELIQLPPGFRYRSFGWSGDRMHDGRTTPRAHDGMGVVRADGKRLTLVRNHELRESSGSFAPSGSAYDVNASGGTTNLVFDTATESLVDSWASLSGTMVNCAGGVTPWGSWLSCEECVIDVGERRRLTRPHGYVFEVSADGLANPEPLKGLGRFVHEAATVDASTGFVYLTEDNRPAGFYRFRPRNSGQLRDGGSLEMLRVGGRTQMSRGVPVGAKFKTSWVPIADPDRGHEHSQAADRSGVLAQGRDQGGALFSRLEGCIAGDGRVVFISTDGGDAGAGQVWEYNDADGELCLVYASPNHETLDHPDNVVISPHGGLILCEDGRGDGLRMQWLRNDGRMSVFAQNTVRLNGERNGINGDFRSSEWAGACFSPDGRWLFANLQLPGITLAITGDWDALA